MDKATKYCTSSLIAVLLLTLLSFISDGQQNIAQNKNYLKTRRDSIRKDSLRLDSIKVDQNYVYSFLLDARDVFVSPYYWNSKQWIVAGTTCAVVTSLIAFNGDRDIQMFAQRNRNSATNFLEKYVGDPMGSGEYPTILVGAAYLSGWIFHKPHIGQFAKLATKSVLLSAGTVTIIKIIAERDRPFQDNPANPLEWHGPGGFFNNTSFSSGHSVVAWSFCSMVAIEFPHPIIIPVLAYSAATLTSFGRINGNFHWASDVIFSAVIGYSYSRLISRHANWGNYKRQMMMKYTD